MDFVRVATHDGIAELRLERGKVNALNGRVVRELTSCFRDIAETADVRAAILTGTGKFFSFGFDIPEFLAYSKEEFTAYLCEFTALYREMFSHPKPLVAAINGHAVAGGCMLAAACDERLMVEGRAKVGLNEIGFGSSVFAGSARMLAHWVGERRAQEILYGGLLYTAREALEFGLVDAVADDAGLPAAAQRRAARLAEKDPCAFRAIKALLRRPAVEEMIAREAESIRDFADVWYSKTTWSRLQAITIRD